MSFFSKLKNTITGDWAEVTVECPGEFVRGQPATIKVTATVKDQDIQVDRVYARVQAHESVDIPSYHHPEIADIDGIDGLAIDQRDETYDKEFVLAQGLKLEAGSTHTWEGEITLPTNEQPTFQGRNARHDWRIFVGLDMTGNDPDSGWHDIFVK